MKLLLLYITTIIVFPQQRGKTKSVLYAIGMVQADQVDAIVASANSGGLQGTHVADTLNNRSY